MGEIVIIVKIEIGADRRQGTHVDLDEAGAEDSEDEVVGEEVDGKSARRYINDHFTEANFNY